MKEHSFKLKRNNSFALSSGGLSQAASVKTLDQTGIVIYPGLDETKVIVGDHWKRKRSFLGLLYGFGAATSYGLLFCSVKYLYTISSITVFEILYLRSVACMPVLYYILKSNGISPFEIKQHVAVFLAVRCLTGYLGFAIQFFAAKFTDLSKIVMIIYNPFLTSLMSFILIGEQINRHDILSFIFGIIGVALLTDPFAKLKGADDIFGLFLASLSAITFNIGFIALRHVRSELNSWQITFYFMMTSMFFSPIGFTGERNSFAWSQSVFNFEWLSVFLVIFIGLVTMTGNFCVNKTLQHEKAARATAYYSLELIYTFIFDIFFSQSKFTSYELSGVGLIVFANLYMYFVNS